MRRQPESLAGDLGHEFLRPQVDVADEIVERLGVTFHFDTRIGRDITFEELQERFDAVAICAGAMSAVPLVPVTRFRRGRYW